MQLTALSTILFSFLLLATGAPLALFARDPCKTNSAHKRPQGWQCGHHRSLEDQESTPTTLPKFDDTLSTPNSTPDPTPYASIQFNLVTNEESYQFGFGLSDLATINAGQQKALKNAVASVQVIGDGKCDIFADQVGDAILAEGVGNEAVILRDGTGIAVGAVRCT